MEKTYNVKDISEMLNTNPETVRRWIRENKLQSTKNSSIGKNVVTQTMLDAFLRSSPKYTKNLMNGLNTPSVITATMAMILGALLADQFFEAKKRAHTNFKTIEILNMLKLSIKESEDEIRKREQKILQLQEEIIMHKKKINQAQEMIDKIKEKKDE